MLAGPEGGADGGGADFNSPIAQVMPEKAMAIARQQMGVLLASLTQSNVP